MYPMSAIKIAASYQALFDFHCTRRALRPCSFGLGRALAPSGGYKYLLTCVDRFTRWPEAFPLTDITVETAAATPCMGGSHGVPSVITTDQGRQFESRLWQQLTKLLGTNESYHSLSPHRERAGRAFPSPAQNSSQSPTKRRQLGTSPAHGAIGHSNSADGRPSLLSSRACLWHNLAFTS